MPCSQTHVLYIAALDRLMGMFHVHSWYSVLDDVCSSLTCAAGPGLAGALFVKVYDMCTGSSCYDV